MAKVMRQKQTNWPRLLILTAIFVSLCAGAQAQVVVEDTSKNWGIDAPGVRGATQVFNRGVTLAFGTYPMQVIECECEDE